MSSVHLTINPLGLLVLLAAALPGQAPTDSPDDALLNVVVWGIHMPLDPAAYSGTLGVDVDAYFKRAVSFRSARPLPERSGVDEMVHAARVEYERRLVAVTLHPLAANLAAEYVDGLKPCYEWEGSHECPEREAMFADEYSAKNPGGPFSEFLPLLSAHRWLCAAEAFDWAKRPADAARSRRLYDTRLAEARKSGVLLIRTAADRLAARERCY